MFDYAISQNKKRRPTGDFLASWVVSCAAHLLVLFLLIQYPQLLEGRLYHRFRSIPLISNIFGSKSADAEENWRTVAVLRPSSKMTAPSDATLKQFLYDWKKNGPNAPPVPVRWGDIQAAIADLPPMPRVKQEAKDPALSLPENELASASPAPGNGNDSSGTSALSQGDSGSNRKETVSLPPPEPAPKPEIPRNVAPTKIPDAINQPADTAPKATDAVKVFENEQKAIRSKESGLFDTKGFPLGEYATQIVERVKENWLIPSNLRNSRGRTTVVFYIDKTGRYTNARIVASSGSNTFDNAALMAIIDSNPFPPLPKGFPGDQVGAKFVFSYNER